MAWTLVGTALGIALLYAATRRVDAAALVVSLRTLSWPWVSLVLAATLAFCAIKAWRWGLLLETVPRVAFRDLHAAVYLGLAVNFLVAHVGELFRAAAVARRQGIPVGTVLASVVIERVLDFIAILALLAVPVMATPDAPDAIVAAAIASAAFVAVAVTGLVVLLHPPAWSARTVSWLGGRLRPRLRDRVAHHLARFRAGLAPLKQPGLMATALLASALQWGLVAAAIWASGLAVAGSVSPMAAIVTFVLIILGLTLPNSPLQIGTTQLAFVVGLGIDGTEVSIAIAASLVYTTFLILPIMLAGAILTMRYPRDE